MNRRRLLIAALLCLGLWGRETPGFAGAAAAPSALPGGGALRLTLMGIDADSDGLRDALQQAVATLGETEAERGALRQLAKASQALLLSADSRQAYERSADVSRAVECLHAVAPSRAVFLEERLRLELLDTPARREVDARVRDALNRTGVLWARTRGERACQAQP